MLWKKSFLPLSFKERIYIKPGKYSVAYQHLVDGSQKSKTLVSVGALLSNINLK